MREYLRARICKISYRDDSMYLSLSEVKHTARCNPVRDSLDLVLFLILCPLGFNSLKVDAELFVPKDFDKLFRSNFRKFEVFKMFLEFLEGSVCDSSVEVES